MPYILHGRDAICLRCKEPVPNTHTAKSRHEQVHADTDTRTRSSK